jgi:acyl-CoA synthetase (AMP-forming)/AMP-acid ligase II
VNLWRFLDHTAERTPHGRALTCSGRELDYATTRAAALNLAERLVTGGIAPGDRVGCLMHNRAEHFVAYYAVAAAGAILVSLNTRLSVGEQRQILDHSGARLLIHDAAHTERAGELASTGFGGNVDSRIGSAATICYELPTIVPTTTMVPRLAAADEPAHLYYTSGTTGTPKGVVLTHRNVCTHAETAVQEIGIGAGDRWAHIAPMFHLADAWATFAVTLAGGSHAFLPHFTAESALSLLQHERITITNLVPTMLNLMVKDPSARGRTYALRTMLSGGAAIAPEVVRAILATFGCDYVQTYGMTETSPYLTLGILPATLHDLPPEERLRIQCKTGRPFAGISLKVVGDDGREVPNDERTVGEIRVRGATVTPGYWNDPTATAAAFDADGYLCTGDLATRDRYGFVDIVDRKKDVIKTGGESVYSIEVENVLYAHPVVLECAVFGLPDAVWGERVVAAVVLRPGVAAEAGELIAFVRGKIGGYKAPKEVRFLPALPRTGSGKITKRALREG